MSCDGYVHSKVSKDILKVLKVPSRGRWCSGRETSGYLCKHLQSVAVRARAVSGALITVGSSVVFGYLGNWYTAANVLQ